MGNSFKDFNLENELLQGISAMGYQDPTPIQQKAIPAILSGDDLIACAQTGTGKTAAFLLPLLQKILLLPADGIHALIIVPTRELALQIDQQLEAISFYVDVRSIAIYGGGSGEKWIQQKRALSAGVDIVIATPGRLLAQTRLGDFDFSKLKFLVLDEADRMLDMGFFDDIIQIVNLLPKQRQTLCFSATMPPKIRQLSKQILNQPKEISLAIAKPAEGIQQTAYLVAEESKLGLLKSILEQKNYSSVIVFASSKSKTRQIKLLLNAASIKAESFSSDLEQEQREELMLAFKNKNIPVLVGTDILSRGIDVDGIDLVINFDVPGDPDDYVHRVGRTARAQREGEAITFICRKDLHKFSRIESLIKMEVRRKQLPAGLQAEEEIKTSSPKQQHKHFKKQQKPSQKKQPQNKKSSRDH